MPRLPQAFRPWSQTALDGNGNGIITGRCNVSTPALLVPEDLFTHVQTHVPSMIAPAFCLLDSKREKRRGGLIGSSLLYFMSKGLLSCGGKAPQELFSFFFFLSLLSSGITWLQQ